MNRMPRRSVGVLLPLALALAPAAVPTGLIFAQPPQNLSREELLGQWDLDNNGTVDAGEIEVARSKMRRERAEMQMRSMIDPLTGRPRGDAGDEKTAVEVEQDRELLEAEEPRPKTKKNRVALPGTRPPEVLPPIPTTRPAAPPTAGAKTAGSRPAGESAADASGAGASPQRGSGRGTFRGLPVDEGRGIVTGGARAGGVARPGYGAALPKPDLNAGRLPAGLPGRRPAPASGGLVPNLRTRPPVSAPPSTTPRRTVDDFDVY